jgi:hypothetical protein
MTQTNVINQRMQGNIIGFCKHLIYKETIFNNTFKLFDEKKPRRQTIKVWRKNGGST